MSAAMTIAEAVDIVLLCTIGVLLTREGWRRYLHTARVVILCRHQGAQVWTGMEMTEAELRALGGVWVFRCVECSEVHRWRSDEAWVLSHRH